MWIMHFIVKGLLGRVVVTFLKMVSTSKTPIKNLATKYNTHSKKKKRRGRKK